MSQPPWYRRFLDNPPPLSDRVWAAWLMSMLVLLGVVLGAGVCVVRQDRAPDVLAPALQHQLDRLEQRLFILEHRKD
jgi:hypothetical protein